MSPSALDHPLESTHDENSDFQLSLPMIFLFSIVALTFQLLPLYLKEEGLSESKIMLLNAIPPIVAILANQLWGYLADIHFRPKTVMIFMSLASVVVMIVFPFYHSFPSILILMGFMTFFSNARVPMVNAMILNAPGKEHRYAFIRSTGSLAFVVAGFLASSFSDWENGPGLISIFPLLALSNLGFALSLINITQRKRTGAEKKEAKKTQLSFIQVQKLLLKKRIIRVFLIFLFLSQVSLVPSMLAQSLYIKDALGLNGTNFDVSMALNIGAISEILFFAFYAKLSKRIRLMPMFFVAFSAGCLRWLIVGYADSVYDIWLASILHLCTYGMMYMCSVMFINKELPPHLRNSGQTLLALIYTGFSIMFGQLLASVYLDHFSLRSWFFFASILALTPFPFWLMMKRLYNKEHGVSGIFIPQEKTLTP